MEQETIENAIKEFNRIINGRFKDIQKLKDAMKADKLPEVEGKNAYTNSALATLGDAVLKLVLLERLYANGNETTAKRLTDEKKKLEKNKVMYDLLLNEGWIKYAYNSKYFYEDAPQHEKVPFNKHPQYLEAIIGAKFLDSNYKETKNWINETIYPLLEKYSKKDALIVGETGVMRLKE